MEAVLAPRLRLALSRRALRVADDEKLVAEVRAGNRSAFEAVYDRHHAGILAFSRHMLGSREESEDVVQHTFAAAYQAMLADGRDIALKAWLYAIARNRCLSVLRSRREHVVLDDSGEMAPSTAGLSAEVEQREDLRALLADLQRLPDDQRAALILAELGAHSHEEIAAILGVPTPKIKALVFQAREALMSRRLGREADCGTIREQLAVLRGGARRRGELRHHVAQCDGCRAFDAEVRRQRAGMAVLLPVVPALALKESSLIAAFAAGGGGGAASAGGGAVAGGAVAGGAVAGGTVAAGGAATGGAVAGGAAAGNVVAGGTAAGGVAGAGLAGGAAAAGGATGLGGAALLTTGGALGAKALTALAITGVAGGGYAVVQSRPDDPKPPPQTQAASARDQQPQQGPKTPLGTIVLPADQDCRKQQPAGGAACAKKPATDSRAGRPSGDRDHDGVPNRADGDRDGDGVANGGDKCPDTPGSVSGCRPPGAVDPTAAGGTRTDRDGDGIPNAEDGDRDGDGVPNAKDECPTRFGTVNGCPVADPSATPPATATPTRGDRDGDGIPNAEDVDRDGDGVSNRADRCPNQFGTVEGCPAPGTTDPTFTPAPGDRDGDGIPNRQDADRDGDGVANGVDACPNRPGPGTVNGCPPEEDPGIAGPAGDRDGDGIPNAEDDDRDGDGVLNGPDACPNKFGLGADGCPLPPPPEPVPDTPTTTTPPPTTTTATTSTVPATPVP